MTAVAAVDLGATSGRVILGYVSHNELRMRHVARFPNQPVVLHEGTGPEGKPRRGLHWDILELHRSLTAGLASARAAAPASHRLTVAVAGPLRPRPATQNQDKPKSARF